MKSKRKSPRKRQWRDHSVKVVGNAVAHLIVRGQRASQRGKRFKGEADIQDYVAWRDLHSDNTLIANEGRKTMVGEKSMRLRTGGIDDGPTNETLAAFVAVLAGCPTDEPFHVTVKRGSGMNVRRNNIIVRPLHGGENARDASAICEAVQRRIHEAEESGWVRPQVSKWVRSNRWKGYVVTTTRKRIRKPQEGGGDALN